MSSYDPERGSQQEKVTVDAYRVHWFPAGAENLHPERTRSVHRAFEDGREEEGGTVCDVWVVDPEETEWPELLRLLYDDDVLGDVSAAAQDGKPQYGMFLFLTTHSLRSWDPPEPQKGKDSPEAPKKPEDTKDVQRHRTLKENEFIIRAFRSYRLGRVVHWDRPDEPDSETAPAASPEQRLRRLEQELQRFKKRQPEFRDLQEGLQRMREDLERLRQIASDEFTGRPWPELAERLSATVKGESEATGDEPDRVIAGVNRPAQTVPQRLAERLRDPKAFAVALRATYQFGLRPHIRAEMELGKSLPEIGQRGSILFHRDIDLLVMAVDPEGGPSADALDLRALLQGRLWAYELLRDLATWFAYAANDWARKSGRAMKVLVIDEVFRQAELDPDSRSARLAADLKERLARIGQAFGPETQPGGVRFDYVTADRAWDVYDHVELGTPLQVLPLFPAQPEQTPAEPVNFFQYDLILVEVEFRGTYVGPAIVEKLSAHLEREAHARDELRTPAIIVLSQTANFNHVQQCLNLGAVAFVRKERMYELPTRVTRARIDQRAVEPQGQKANFRALYSLPHEDVSRLQSTVRDDCVLGVPDDAQERRWIQALPKADLHSHIGTHIDLATIQALSFNTVGHLLDRRAGNPDMAEGVDQLINDVCRLVLVASRLHAQQRDKHPAVLLEEAANTVLGEPTSPPAPAEKNGREPSPYERLIKRLKARDNRLNPFEITSLLVAVLMLVRARFTDEDAPGALPAPLQTWEYVEKLADRLDQAWATVQPVPKKGSRTESSGASTDAAPAGAAQAAAAGGEAQTREGAGQDGRKHLDGWLALRRLRVQRLLGHISDKVSRRAEAVRSVVHRDTTRMKAPGNTLREVHDSLEAWPHDADEEQVFEEMRAPVRTYEEELRRCVRRIARRVPYAWWKLNRRLDDVLEREQAENEEKPVAAVAHIAANFLAKTRQEREEGRLELSKEFEPLTLQELVVIPANPQPTEKTLSRYLWGADLLGADHLQYPENLLLAARSVVRQCTAENIWYTELRCETAGYTEGGMVAVDATDLLCTALDLAVAYGVEHPEPQRARQQRTRDAGWARFSILLGAKRHKTPERFKEIVGLATYYMQQRDEEELFPFAPIWWKPASVAGFDLSGDENAKQEGWRKIMKPLFKHSTPITIHAGEAASAESIWQAVYLYGARRIGHGLRLRENRRLLNHCISEGICMELCPISNKYTNSFPKAQDDYESDWWEYYPLRYYMEQGLDLCINTDNRQLHPEGGNTLTDEYLCAAELVGGLSRWNVLRIAKAGFKHAFLPKREIGVMLRAVESQVYELVVDPDGDMMGSRFRGGWDRVYVGKLAKDAAPEDEVEPVSVAPDDEAEPPAGA
jgi:adenosine deaminase/CheY-like chemotaxis protein